MPKQKRWAIKQKLETALIHLHKAQTHLIEVGQLYKEVHPDYYERFSQIVSMHEILINTVMKLRDDI